MPIHVALDASFIIVLLNEKDLWHSAALQLLRPLETKGTQQCVFDCVLSEVVRTLARRVRDLVMKEQGPEFCTTKEILEKLHP